MNYSTNKPLIITERASDTCLQDYMESEWELTWREVPKIGHSILYLEVHGLDIKNRLAFNLFIKIGKLK